MKEYNKILKPVDQYNTCVYYRPVGISLKESEYFDITSNKGVECTVIGIHVSVKRSRKEYDDYLDNYPRALVVKKKYKSGPSKRMYYCYINKDDVATEEHLDDNSRQMFVQIFPQLHYYGIHLIHQYEIAKQIAMNFRFYPSIPEHYWRYMQHNQFFDELWFKRKSITKDS